MWSMWTRTQRDEVERHRLVFCCEDCLHFRADAAAPAPADGAPVDPPPPPAPGANGRGGCDLLYPTGPHRRATVDALPEGAPIAFCKMFEAS